MQMDAGLDTGPVRIRRSLDIGATETLQLNCTTGLASMGADRLWWMFWTDPAGPCLSVPQVQDRHAAMPLLRLTSLKPELIGPATAVDVDRP